MCITRPAKVLALEGDRARVRFLDRGSVDTVDASLVEARKGSYVDIFAGRAVGLISREEAEFKRALRLEMDRLGAGVRL